jgi:hypothetical protein
MTIKYGEFSFDPCHGFTGSTGKKAVKGYMRGGYAEGGMRSESTQEAKATRDVQDSAMKPARQLNKSLKNLNEVRKQTGYGMDLDSDMPSRSTPSFAKGGLRKIRSDKGKTQQVITASGGPRIGGASMPGQIGPADTGSIQSPTSVAAPSIGGAMTGMKMGGRTKRR